MATDPFYYDPYSTTTPTSWSNDPSGTATTSASSIPYFDLSGACPLSTSTTTPYNSRWIRQVVTRKILVSAPKHWTREQNLQWTDMVNINTNTGWKVTMIIEDGQIIITDPDIERRSMSEFLPLLKSEATMKDIETINDFIEKNPIT